MTKYIVKALYRTKEMRKANEIMDKYGLYTGVGFQEVIWEFSSEKENDPETVKKAVKEAFAANEFDTIEISVGVMQ